MEHSDQVERTNRFHWETRQDLYSYFVEKQGLTPSELDEKIEAARASFRLRKGQAIRTQELWQKVGLDLTRQLGISLDPTPEEHPPVSSDA